MKRSEYMDKYSGLRDAGRTALHRAYHAQYVDERVRNLVLRHIGRDKLLASVDPHFNDIPLRFWDWLVPSLGKGCDEHMRRNGDWLSLGSGVCVLKEAARQIVESAK